MASNQALRLFFAFFIASTFYYLLISFRWTSSLLSLIGALSILLYWSVKKRYSLQFPAVLELYLAFFTFASLFLGEAFDFYYRYSYWDSALHLSSAFVVAAMGYSLVDFQTTGARAGFKSLFAFSFAMMVGVLWEFLEFSIDFFFGTNMQKFIYGNGEILAGQQALLDTMLDLMECAAGAGLLILLVLLKRKYKISLLDKFLVKKSDLL